MTGESIMRLSDVVGHESTIKRLRRSLADGRLPHALVFHGPHGVGKRSIAVGTPRGRSPHA